MHFLSRYRHFCGFLDGFWPISQGIFSLAQNRGHIRALRHLSFHMSLSLPKSVENSLRNAIILLIPVYSHVISFHAISLRLFHFMPFHFISSDYDIIICSYGYILIYT